MPRAVQRLFKDAVFVGNEAALIRIMGMEVAVGWLYFFGGLSGGRRIAAASVLDRVVFVRPSAGTLSHCRRISSFSAHVCSFRPDPRDRRLAP